MQTAVTALQNALQAHKPVRYNILYFVAYKLSTGLRLGLLGQHGDIEYGIKNSIGLYVKKVTQVNFGIRLGYVHTIQYSS